MTVRIQDGAILLEGRCPAADAEELFSALQQRPHSIVDLSRVLALHMAVLQILLALRPVVTGRPRGGLFCHDILRDLISVSDSEPESF